MSSFTNLTAGRTAASLLTTNFGGVTKATTSRSLSDILSRIPISQITQIDPGILQLIGQGATAVTPTPTPTTPATPAPTTPLDLQLAILAIPTAYDGQPITTEYHNALRDAVRAIAGHLGANAVGQVGTQTFAPAFLPIDGIAPWLLGVGVASSPSDPQSWAGWFPVQLPDGSSIEGMTAIGRRAGGFKLLQVRLLRQALSGSDPADTRYALTTTPLITLDLSNAAADFTVPGTVNVSGLSAGAVEEFKVVDNTKYKYLIHAFADRGDGQLAQINAVQVYCRVS